MEIWLPIYHTQIGSTLVFIPDFRRATTNYGLWLPRDLDVCANGVLQVDQVGGGSGGGWRAHQIPLISTAIQARPIRIQVLNVDNRILKHIL